MFKNYKIIKELNKLKNTSLGNKFLSSLRKDLEEYTKFHPVRNVRNNGSSRLLLIESLNIFNKFKLKLMPVLIIALIAIMGGGGTVAASQNSVPGDALYPVKTIV